jgi:hypothetical protein
MRRFVFCLLLSVFGLLIFAACQAGPAPTATFAPTSAPSDTPVVPSPAATATAPTPIATVTTAPSATATPSAPVTSALPTATVTPDPNLGVGDVTFEDKFDGASGWGWTFQGDGVTFGVAEGQLVGAMSRSDKGWSITLGPDALSVGDHQLRVRTRAAACGPLDEYGLFWRGSVSEDGKFNGYVFKLNCSRQAQVELLRANETSLLLDLSGLRRGSSAIASGAGAENTITLWMAKDQFHFYVNDEYLGSLKDATYAEGALGFYLWKRSEGEATRIQFDDLTVRTITAP